MIPFLLTSAVQHATITYIYLFHSFRSVCLNFECIVTVYTQFGYAQMDVDKYKDDFNPQNMNGGGASPEKQPAAADEQKEQQIEGGGGIMQQTSSAVSEGGTPLIVSNGDKMIELTYKWGKGYI